MQQNNKTPKTAVIMPAYNSGATIEASVRSILNQTVSNLVLIVVDDRVDGQHRGGAGAAPGGG